MWTLAALVASVRADPLITEFMAANTASLVDEDGAFSDWVEIHNPDAAPVNLAGWYLTDSAGNKTRWQFPAVTLPAGGYMVVFASNKDRVDSAKPLHTNFALSAGGEYLGLIKPDGVTVAHEYAPEYPAQRDDVAYGLPPAPGGGFAAANYLSRPTPAAANSGGGSGPISGTVAFSRAAGPFRLAFNLELSGSGGQIRYVVASGSNAWEAEVTATSAVYSGPILIDKSVVVRAALFSADGSVRGPVTTLSYSRLNANITGFSSQLPVVVIDSLGSGPLFKDNADWEGSFFLYAARGNNSPVFTGTPDVVSPLTATVRGSSSADFPKKGYNVKFTNEQGKKREQPLLDFPAFEKWALVAPWSFDLSYLSNAFTYSLSNQIGRWAPRARLVEVFFNADGNDVESSDYVGIYVLTDRVEIDEDRVNIATLRASDVSGDAVTGGYLLKIDPPDADETGWKTQRGMPTDSVSTIVLVSPKADEAEPAQLAYIKDYIQRMENALYADQATGFAQRTYLDYVDRASWVDHHLLNTFVSNPDAFIRSAYFHKDRGGKLAAGPVWDFDRAIGSYWDERSWRPDVWFGVGSPDYWRVDWWGVIASDPEFMQDWIDRWQSLRRNELSTSGLRALVDSLSAQVGNEAALRDATRWPDNSSPFGNHTATVDRMRTWLTERARWIDQQFVAAPNATVSGGSITFTAPAGAQLVFTLDGSDPRSLGGDIAPNAQVTSEPLTVAADANVHVRSYRAALRDVFPGSPWSSAAGGEASSPLAPKARLVNISSRAIVGSGEDALIAGVVVADTEGKRYLSRAIGPGLAAFGASGYVADPQLSIFAGNGTELFRNNAWETGPDAVRLPTYARNVGAFPLATGSRDSALASEIAAGPYTVQVTTPSGQNGVGLAELYELDSKGRTVNLSTRAYVRTDDGVLIGGFVVTGPAYKRMLIRAVGPTLAAFGVGNALRDPILTVYRGAAVVATNDRWEQSDNPSAVSSAMRRVGAFALATGGEDAAMLITLPPGAYTVEVKGKDGLEGVGLLEIYEVP